MVRSGGQRTASIDPSGVYIVCGQHTATRRPPAVAIAASLQAQVMAQADRH